VDLAAPVRGAERVAPSPEPPREPWPIVSRVLFELLMGSLVAGALGGAAAAVTGETGDGWLFGFATVAPLSFSLGTWLGGVVAGGHGELLWTLLGGLAGGLVAGAFLLAGYLTDRDPMDGVDPAFTGLGAVSLIALPPLLSVLGYELSWD
jgi:hypothetical protein